MGTTLFRQIARRRFLRTARIEVVLQENLSCHAIASLLALLVRQARVPQGRLRLACREALVPEDPRQTRLLAEPGAELVGQVRLLASPAREMYRQADHELHNRFLFDKRLEKAAVLLPVAANVGLQRRGDAPIRIADGQADADLAMIDPQQPARAHRYFSSDFLRISSTSC